MILAILQARMSSSRLPGKVLKTIVGKPVLALQLERLSRCKQIDKLIVATSIEASDEPIEKLCSKLKIECFRGDLADVLNRFYQLSNHQKAKHIVRLTGDCPLVDPRLVDQVINHHVNGKFDYTSNIYPRSYPDGLDVEIMTKATLDWLNKEATSQEDREHVTYFLEKRLLDDNLTNVAVGNVNQKRDLSSLRWTLDTPEDFELIERIYQALYKNNPTFTTNNILEYLKL